METTHRFFAKLRKLAVTLETETARIQESLENRNKDEVDSETSARAMRAFHELKSEVGTMKGQIQDQLSRQKAKESEVSGFIKACRAARQRVTEDGDTLRELWDKYGYKAPAEPQRPGDKEGDGEEDEIDAAAEREEEGSQEEAGEEQAPSPPDPLRTPQLSDFGLSEVLLKRALGGAEWCAEPPPLPAVSLARPPLRTPTPPPVPRTPTRALRMDEAELQSPQMHKFGISEHTMCLYNDFTMSLMQKNMNKPQRPTEDDPLPPVETLKESLQMKENLESPEPPVFSTLGFQIKKSNKQTTSSSPPPPPQIPKSPPRPEPPQVFSSPEVPAFQTPHVNRLVSSKKSQRRSDSPAAQTDDDGSKPTTPTRSAAPGSKRTWEYDVPDVGVEDTELPEMPNLESHLGKSLQKRSAKMPKKTCGPEPVSGDLAVRSLELDDPTQEFSLGTPRIRTEDRDPCTPEMPDLSAVTQDICKLVSRVQKKTEVAVVQPNVRTDERKVRILTITRLLSSAPSLSVVSESEFQSLPRYMRQMALSNLNQVVHNINKFAADFPGKKLELSQEELRRISNVGTKTPVYVLCLTELKRLQHVGGASNTAVYRLSAHN